jgi:tetrapyrrole methylase family protein/MazG family protein
VTGTVVVVGLGPAGPDLLAPAALTALASVPPAARFLRTTVHPAAAAVEGASSFDHLYDAASDVADVYAGIVDALVAAAGVHGRVVYAVPGSPLVAEHTIELLRERPDVVVEIVPSLSFLDLCWARLGIDPLAAGVRLVDGHRFAVEAAGERGPLLVAQLDSPFVLSEVKLAVESEPAAPVTLLHHLGLPDEQVVTIAWEEIDHFRSPDHLTSLWIPELDQPVAMELQRFRETVRRLREQCPWDREQTHESLIRYVLEEANEVVEAITALGDVDGYDDAEPEAVNALCDELGDLLLQVFLHAAIAEQEGWFSLADVAAAVNEKMVRRHPHVFGDVVVADADEVARNWERIKAEERDARPEGGAGAS